MVLRAEKPDAAAVGAASWIRESGTQNLWNEVLFGYDPNTGLLTTLTEKELEQTGFGQPISGPGHVTHSYVTTQEHDLWDRVTKVTRVSAGDDVVHHYRYDTASGLVEFEDSLGAKLRWVRSGLGHVVKRSELGVPPTGGGKPLDITTHSQVDFASRVVTRTDAEGRVSKFCHDEAWRLVLQELPGYQAGGQSRLQTFTYDDASRIIQVINGRGQKVDRSYDAAGRLLAQWLVTPPADTGLRATKEMFRHDFLGRLRTVETLAAVAHDQLVWSGAAALADRVAATPSLLTLIPGPSPDRGRKVLPRRQRRGHDTVMAVSVEQTVATLRARASARQAAQAARARVVRDRLLHRLESQLPPGTKAWLIGSLAWGGFGEHSDVDLVLLGADSGLASRLELLLTRELDVPVEVLRAEELPASFRQRVEREGIACHGA